ncbi:hypothetical protein H4582DRAFT_459276 [Lactarius indigo]|nr:hypothetical protein H4582DRAFT_459276 [Lactarius indigo]
MNPVNLPKPTPAWALSFPEPRSHPLSMSPDELHKLLTTKILRRRLHSRRRATHRYRRVSIPVLRQVYRVSHICCDDASRQAMITGAINLPAQTFYPLLPTLASILGKFPIVVFHCSSSLGRAPRCAGWLQDRLPPDSECKIFILEGGMKAWRERFGEGAQMIVEMPVEEGEDIGTRK